MNASRHAIAAVLAIAALLSPFAAFAQSAGDTVTASVSLPETLTAAYSDAPDASRVAIAKADALASEGKWLSAWNVLGEADPENKDGFILSEKIRIALDGYAQNVMHVVFAFIDLPEGADLATVRQDGIEGLEPVEFDPWAAWQALEASGAAAPPVLSMNLADYYYEVRKNYEGQWFEDDQIVLGRALEQYDRALAYDFYTSGSLQRHAELLSAAGNSAGAEPILLKAIALDPENIALIMSLVDSYTAQGRIDEAFARIDALLALESDAQTRYDTITKGIQIGLQSGDDSLAEPYIRMLENDFPDDYLAAFLRHMIAANSGDAQAAATIADALYAAHPGDSQIVSTLLSSWISAGKAQDGLDFIDRSVALSPDDTNSLAILHFYRALVLAEVAQSAEDLKLGLEDLGKAEEYFVAAGYPADSGVFQTIAQLRAEWDPAPAADESATTAPATAAPATESATSVPPAAEGEAADATSAASSD
ncbi:MAG: tetratricopeptide repeat protein [Rectinemataceae bacterium]